MTGLSARASILTWWRCAWNIFWFTIFSSISSFTYASKKEKKENKKNEMELIYLWKYIHLDRVYRVCSIIVSLSSNFPFLSPMFFCFAFVYKMNHKRLKLEWLLKQQKIIKFNSFSSSFGHITFWLLRFYGFGYCYLLSIHLLQPTAYRLNDQFAFHLWHTPHGKRDVKRFIYFSNCCDFRWENALKRHYSYSKIVVP